MKSRRFSERPASRLPLSPQTPPWTCSVLIFSTARRILPSPAWRRDCRKLSEFLLTLPVNKLVSATYIAKKTYIEERRVELFLNMVSVDPEVGVYDSVKEVFIRFSKTDFDIEASFEQWIEKEQHGKANKLNNST